VEPGFLFDLVLDRLRGRKSAREFEWEFSARSEERNLCGTNAASINLSYQGVGDDLNREQEGLYPRPLLAYDEEAREKNWMPRLPRQSQPRAWVTGGNNVLRRSNLTHRSLEHLWPALELIVDVNFKLGFTGMHADYLLPAAGYYEKPGIKYPVSYIPYLHYCDAAVPPVGESKDEWEIFWLLAQEVQRVARERNTPVLDGCGKQPVDLHSIGERFSFHGEIGPKDAERVAQLIFDESSSTVGMTVEGLKQTGIAKYTSPGAAGGQPQLFNDDWKGEGVLRACTHFTEGKWHWPTLTGRQQFYIDHPWFLEAGEALPSHRESPRAGGDYPFQLISCHARWSVHSVWRDTTMLLRLQRGEPALYLNPRDAEDLGIADGGWAELFNRHGRALMRVKYSTMVRPRVAYYFHAWEPHQFPGHRSFKFITPGLMNPLHFAGGEGHLGWRFLAFEPGTHVQDTRVGLRPAPDGPIGVAT
jgi:anaerobic selenocysteine-containing dehydrogenase